MYTIYDKFDFEKRRDNRKKSYERLAYESVDDSNHISVMSQKSTEKNTQGIMS